MSNELEPTTSFQGLRVAALESRRGEDMHRLIERFGGVPFVSASMREIPVESNREVIDFAYRVLSGEISVVIFMTGVAFVIYFLRLRSISINNDSWMRFPILQLSCAAQSLYRNARSWASANGSSART